MSMGGCSGLISLGAAAIMAFASIVTAWLSKKK